MPERLRFEPSVKQVHPCARLLCALPIPLCDSSDHADNDLCDQEQREAQADAADPNDYHILELFRAAHVPLAGSIRCTI